MRIHYERKTFICELCDKAFFDDYTLKRHIRVHTGEKPFICSLCGKACNQLSNLKSHMWRMHQL